MNYFDDLFNVNAYLRLKMRESLSETQAVIAQQIELDRDFNAMNSKIDANLKSMLKAAEELGIKTDDIMSAPVKRSKPLPDSCAELLVSIPNDYDFDQAFRELCEEAHKAGFTDVHPEELLTESEMEHAREFDKALDRRFEAETGLTAHDGLILSAAVIIRVICRFISKYVRSADANAEDPPDGSGTPSVQPASDTAPVFVNATQGVNMDDVLRGGGKYVGDLAGDTAQTAFGSGIFDSAVYIRDEFQILNGALPIDVSDNNYFTHKDILGFRPVIGWLFGVTNILTSTVTTTKMETYSVTESPSSSDLTVDKKLSTLLQVVLPVINNIRGRKRSVLAAVVREAAVQGVTNAPAERVAALMNNVLEEEEKNQEVLDQLGSLTWGTQLDLGGVLTETAAAAFINLLITAIHAVSYDPDRDGDISTYTIRTNKILVLSTAISAFINSTPALITSDFSDIDFSGFLIAAITAFNSTKFWIEVKTNYLVSNYKAEIDKQMEIINKYFKTTDAGM